MSSDRVLQVGQFPLLHIDDDDDDVIGFGTSSGRALANIARKTAGFGIIGQSSTSGLSSSYMLNDDDDDDIWYTDENMAAQSFPRFEEIRRMGKLCDVALIVGDRRLSAHRIVLAATVPYFYSMFTQDFHESSQREITMQGIDAETLEQLVNFAYSGRVRVTSQNVQSLLVGASFLQLQSICDACCQYLQSRLQCCNVLTVRNFASALGCDGLVQAADRYIQKHFTTVCRTDEFLLMAVDDVENILQRDELYVNSEEPIYEAAMAWIRNDTSNRSQHASRLLRCVRLPLLKPQFITDRVAAEEVVKNCLRCRDLVDEAKDYHLMPERRQLMQTFRTIPRCCTDIPGLVYAVGGLTNSGDSLSTVEVYNPVTNRWSTIEPMTTLRSRVGVSVMHGKLYAIGGFNGHERLRTVEVFDPQTRVWKQISSLNNKRSALGAAVIGDYLYVCGGYDGMTSLSTVEVYDQSVGNWSMIHPMNKQRSAAGIAVLDGKIYILGGHDGMSIFNSVECYDPESGRWTQTRPMLNRRCRLGATAASGKIYACGGYDGSQFLRSVECYDPQRDEWTHVPSMNVKRSRVALVSNCGKLFAIGGYDGISNLSSIEIFDTTDSVWRFGGSMMAHEGGVGIGVVPTISLSDP